MCVSSLNAHLYCDDVPALGFTIIDENSPVSEVAKKKEQFFRLRLKKEQEQRMKQMEREKEATRRKEEARLCRYKFSTFGFSLFSNLAQMTWSRFSRFFSQAIKRCSCEQSSFLFGFPCRNGRY